MEASPIIPEIDIASDVLPCFLPGRVNGAVDPLDFQRRVERFRQGIVKANACPAHGLADPQPAQDRRELYRGVIAAMPLSYAGGLLESTFPQGDTPEFCGFPSELLDVLPFLSLMGYVLRPWRT